MIQGLSRGTLFALVLTAGAWRVNALDPGRKISQYVRDRWGSDSGLAGKVQVIAQTNDGSLWIGTSGRLFRFDGRNFTPVSDQSPSPVSLVNVIGLLVNDKGNLVVRLPERNLLQYAEGTFENILYSLEPRELAITAMCRGKDGDILVTGIVHGVMRYRNGRFEPIVSTTSLPPSPVVSMAQSADGKIWLGTREAGLFYIEGNRVSAVDRQIPNRKVNALLSEGSNVWVGTDSGMALWNGTELTSQGVPLPLQRARVLAMLTDRSANLWVGTGSGVFRVNGSGLAALDNPERGADPGVNSLFEDREGGLWIGGPWGLECLRDGSFTTYGKAEGLPSDHAGPVYADAEGHTWFAPLEGGLYRLDRGVTKRVAEAALSQDVVYSIAGNHDMKHGEIWIGRQRGGLTRLVFSAGEMHAETFTKSQGLAQNSVYSVFVGRDGTVWAGTLSGGVSRYRDGKFVTYSRGNGLGSNTVASILESSDGTMWFATPNGLRGLANGHWLGFTAKEGLPADDVDCLLEDSRGILWVGTSGGLAFVTANGVARAQGVVEALHDPIFGLAEDQSGSLWIATSGHITRVDRDKLLRGVLASGDDREYSLADGLRSTEGTRRDRSVIADRLGRIWFGMSNGLSEVRPAELNGNAVPPVVRIQAISADNRVTELHEPVRIPSPPRRITFVYSGVSLWEPDRVRFRYRLDGYDSGWSEPTAGREAAYTNLSPGPYRFRVIASNPDGVWNSEATAIGFDVSPLFWQTWWFRLAAVLGTGLVLLVLYRLRLGQHTARLNVRFEERLAERTRIAQELHDTLLQGFLSASLQLQVVAGKLPPDSPTKQPLGRIIERMKDVVDEGRNAIRGLRSSHGVSLDLEKAFLHIRQEFQVADEIGYRVIVDGKPRPLHPLLRDEVYRIGREAVVNALRHSQAKEIDLEIEYATRHMRVRVRDNGCGIDPHVLEAGREGHWGLPGMRERAEKIGGRLRVFSQLSGGTEIELSVPGHVAFLDASSGRLRTWLARATGKARG